MTRTFEQWAESEGLDMSVDWTGELTSPVTAGALRGWEAAQSAGQEAVACPKCGCEHGIAHAPYWNHKGDWTAEAIWVCDKCDGERIINLDAAPVNGGERETFRCATCRDGELFPQYGVAPHKCFYKIPGATLGQSELLPRSEWPENFTPDAENPQCGTWTCPDCGPRAADAQQVGGDEREVLIQSMKNAQEWIAASRARCDEIERDRWDALQRVIDFLACAALPADGGEAANLEGLRDKLFDGRQVTRDAEGWYYHPALPNTDEDVNLENLLAALRIESVFVSMESDDSEAADRYGEAGEADCHYWKPTAPEGEGWRLLAVYDTEDGPYALFGRDAHVAEKKRKQESTRQRAEAIAASTVKEGA